MKTSWKQIGRVRGVAVYFLIVFTQNEWNLELIKRPVPSKYEWIPATPQTRNEDGQPHPKLIQRRFR